MHKSRKQETLQQLRNVDPIAVFIDHVVSYFSQIADHTLVVINAFRLLRIVSQLNGLANLQNA